MKTKEAVEIFGSFRALADALGISTQAVYLWGENVPELRTYQIKVIMMANGEK